MKLIPVTCALIEKEGKVLCAQRSKHMKHPLKWEFPGGKVEENESLEECLLREIQEELGVEIKILQQLPSHRHSYPFNITIELIPFRCSLISSDIKLKEHAQIAWVLPKNLLQLDWVEADLPIVDQHIKNH